MVQFNFSERTIKAKVVYYGPAQSGKTTNLEQIHSITDPAGTNRLISLNTAQDRTLFFDLLPFSLGAVAGYDFKVQLYTVPGQVQYNATRRVVLAGADAVVFVVDSRKAMYKENLAAFENMKVNLLANRLVPEKVPLVLQYNKQDLPDLSTEAELNKGLNPWGRRVVSAVAAEGRGVAETFVGVVEDMLVAIAIKYNLKEKGLDPEMVPGVVAEAFSSILKQAAETPRPVDDEGHTMLAPAKVVLGQATDVHSSAPLQASSEIGLVSEELLHRSIRSSVDLAEALAMVVREVNTGLATIVSQAEMIAMYKDDAREKRNAAVTGIQQEAARLRKALQNLGQAAAERPPSPPAGQPVPRRSLGTTAGGGGSVTAVSPALGTSARLSGLTGVSPRVNAPAGASGTPAVAAGPGFDVLLRELSAAARPALDAHHLSVDLRIPADTAPPRCPPQELRKALAGLLEGIAGASAPRTVVTLRSERKPVLLATAEGEVKRDFLMLAISHAATLSADEQQAIAKGRSPGSLGEASRLVREMGGFIRYAPLPAGLLEMRVFLPGS